MHVPSIEKGQKGQVDPGKSCIYSSCLNTLSPGGILGNVYGLRDKCTSCRAPKLCQEEALWVIDGSPWILIIFNGNYALLGMNYNTGMKMITI